MKKLFLAASALFAAIPGVAIILKGVGTPPGYENLFGGIVEACGALALITLWINRGKLQRISASRITRFVVALSVISFVALITYIWLFGLCVVSYPTHDTAYYPLWLTGDIARYVARTGGRYEALGAYGITAIQGAISRMPPYVLALTTATLLFVYQAVFTSLALAFGLAGFHKGRDIDV